MELFIELLNQQLISIHFRVAISSIVIDVTIKHRNTFYNVYQYIQKGSDAMYLGRVRTFIHNSRCLIINSLALMSYVFE